MTGGHVLGDSCLLVDIADDHEDGLRVYLTHRALGEYAVIHDPAVIDRVRRMWAGGGIVALPAPRPSQRFQDARPEGPVGAEYRP